MSSLYLDRKNLTVKLDGQALALYEADQKKGTVPLHLLERVIIKGTIQLDSRVLGALSQRNIGLLVLSGRGVDATAMLMGRPHGDASRRLGQYRLSLCEASREPLARWLVLAKVREQQKLLRQALAVRPDQRKPLTGALNTMQDIGATLRDDRQGVSLSALRGYEGSAAAAYFGGYRSLFAESLQFSGRNKRPPKDPVNVGLSLGYTLLHYDAVRACHCVGLDPMLGFYHDVSFGRESLACDLIEPLRPVVDRWVWQLFRERRLRVEDFGEENGRCLMNKSGRQSFYAFYESQAGPVRRLLRRYGYALAKRLSDIAEA